MSEKSEKTKKWLFPVVFLDFELFSMGLYLAFQTQCLLNHWIQTVLSLASSECLPSQQVPTIFPFYCS